MVITILSHRIELLRLQTFVYGGITPGRTYLIYNEPGQEFSLAPTPPLALSRALATFLIRWSDPTLMSM